MIDKNQIDDVIGRDVYSTDGEKIGRAGQVFVDDETGRPVWATVRTGLFGLSESFVPLQSAALAGNLLSIPYGKDVVKDAPRVDPEAGHLSIEQEDALHRHYGMEAGDGDRGDSQGVDADDEAALLHPRDEPGSEDDRRPERQARSDTEAARELSRPRFDDAMARPEDHLPDETERQDLRRVTLRRYVAAEHRTGRTPGTLGEVGHSDREAVTSGPDDAMIEAGYGQTEVVTLYGEHPVVNRAQLVDLHEDTEAEEAQDDR